MLRNLGGAFGLALMDTARDVRLDYHWTQIIPSIDTARPIVVQQLQHIQVQLAGVSADPAAAAVKVLAQRVALQAQTLAFNDVFLWLGLAYLAAVPLMAFMRKPSGAVAGGH